MSIKSVLARIQDELDAIQIEVRLIAAPHGVSVLAKNYAEKLIAMKAVEQHGLKVLK